MTTRARRSRLDALLKAEGARVFHVPALRIVPLRAPVREPAEFDWLAFTSATAVEHYFDALWRRRLDARAVRGRIAAVGPGTAAALRRRGLCADLVPGTFTTHALGVALARAGAWRVLHPCADIASKDLHHKNLEVTDLPLYKLARPSRNGRAVESDIITFASAQTARNFFAARSLPPRVKVVTIGPATSEAVRGCGTRVTGEARPHTFEGIVQAVVRCAHR